MTPGYVGELLAVQVAGHAGRVEVQRVALGVDALGLVTAEDRAELQGGLIYEDPGAARLELQRIWYYRRRAAGAYWYHDTPGATCGLVGPDEGDGAPFAWLDSGGSVLCGPENFICEE